MWYLHINFVICDDPYLVLSRRLPSFFRYFKYKKRAILDLIFPFNIRMLITFQFSKKLKPNTKTVSRNYYF